MTLRKAITAPVTSAQRRQPSTHLLLPSAEHWVPLVPQLLVLSTILHICLPTVGRICPHGEGHLLVGLGHQVAELPAFPKAFSKLLN